MESEMMQRLETLVTLVDKRIYPLVLPQKPTLPAITYQRISGTREQSLTGDSKLIHPRYQFTCWATTQVGARAVAEQVRLALQGGSPVGAGIYENDLDLYDAETGWYYIPVDITIWRREA